MDKLELKHLAPYLHYGLKARMSLPFDNETITEIVGLSENHAELIGIRQTVTEHFEFTDIKPILRPLSDLTKEIEHNSEKFVPTERFYELIDNIDLLDNMFEDIYSKNEILHWPYNVIEKLLEWHFNVFNFPENLYINYNNI